MKNWIPCVVCSRKATWSYGPGDENYCDEHVPRGCSCNADLKEGIDYNSEEAKDPANWVEKLDDNGRRYPCCEYFMIDEALHDNDVIVSQGWEAYFEYHPEQRRESEEVEFWENKLGLNNVL